MEYNDKIKHKYLNLYFGSLREIWRQLRYIYFSYKKM